MWKDIVVLLHGCGITTSGVPEPSSSQLGYHLLQPTLLYPGYKLNMKGGRMGNNPIRMPSRVDRCIHALHNMERPKQECKIDVQRLICDMLSWAYSVDDTDWFGPGIQYDRDNVPSAKAIWERGHIVPEQAVVVNPSLGVEFLGFWEDLRVSRDSPR